MSIGELVLRWVDAIFKLLIAAFLSARRLLAVLKSIPRKSSNAVVALAREVYWQFRNRSAGILRMPWST
jgi:hypothetical protein